MSAGQLKTIVAIALGAGCISQVALAHDIRLTLPRRSELTPVQRLNREGVAAVQKHQYEKAEGIFYKAYLYDPADPFTLNNLGYVSELQGNLERALKFYALAAQQGSDATIDRSDAKQLEGKPMNYAFTTLKDAPLRVNRLNVEAMGLLSQNRSLEANLLLEQALAIEPKNPFTLNNLGVAAEGVGDYDAALKYYGEASASGSTEPAAIALKDSWRGKPVSEIAAASARELEKRMKSLDDAQVRAAMLTTRGVSAANRNDWKSARQDFLAAYALDPNSAFTLNNLGYVAERDGDLETAEFFYARAKKAGDAGARVGLATQPAAQGKSLLAVATDSDAKVDNRIDRTSEALHEQTGPVELIHRDNIPDPPKPSPPQSNSSPQSPSAPMSPSPGSQTPR